MGFKVGKPAAKRKQPMDTPSKPNKSNNQNQDSPPKQSSHESSISTDFSSYKDDFADAPKSFKRVMKAAVRSGAMHDKSSSTPQIHDQISSSEKMIRNIKNTIHTQKNTNTSSLDIKKGESIKDFNR